MNAYELESPERKLVMWYKCKEKREMGLTKAQIARELGLDVKTVRRYLSMSYDEFKSSGSYKRMYMKVLDSYESKVYGWLDEHPDLSSSQIYDWLRERYEDFPTVNIKTVYNFVKYVRAKYNIDKPILSAPRQYCRLEETAFGEYAQADFGEMWMQYADKRKLKVYFFVMVLCRSRKKYVWFSRTPFTTELAIYAHEKAFGYYGGKPKNIIYDQDAVLLHSENMGDYILTKSFNAYVNQAHFKCIFCRKSDPESKGKVENAVKYVKYNFLRGRTFVSIDQLNDDGIRWLSRTANGLPHGSTKQIPDIVFEEEKSYLTPYNGTPSMPQKTMKEYKIHRNNAITYRGCEYSVPRGSYKNKSSFAWISVKDNVIEVYDGETGKQLAVHPLSAEKGKYVLDPSHRIQTHVGREEKVSAIMEYCNYDELAGIWIDSLLRVKPRYYNNNLRVIFSEMRHYDPSILHKVFEISLDKGMYNAKDFISLCERLGGRIPLQGTDQSLCDKLPAAATEMPEKTNINQYNIYFT